MTTEKMNYLQSEGIDVFSSLERLGNDMELLDMIVDLFFKDAKSNVEKFEESIEAGNKEEAYNAVHTLKSLSANLSMEKLNELCVRSCEYYKSGSYDECIGLLQQIKTEYFRVVKALQNS